MFKAIRAYVCLRLIEFAIKIAPPQMQLIFCKAFIEAARLYKMRYYKKLDEALNDQP